MNGNGNGNGNNWKTIGAVIGGLVALAGLMNQKVDSLYTQLNQKIDERAGSTNERINDARAVAYKCEEWQSDYMRGRIPSSSEPKLAAIEKMFAEVETQFRAFRERMIENENLAGERTNGVKAEVDELRARLRETREAQARHFGQEEGRAGTAK